MKWIEFVHLRSSPEGRRRSLSDLDVQIARYRDVEHLTGLMVLRHSIYPGDGAVVLSWENERQPVKTREGTSLAEIMRRHGSVEHAVWEVVSGQEPDAVTPVPQRDPTNKGR